jgi:hypothetical protein
VESRDDAQPGQRSLCLLAGHLLSQFGPGRPPAEADLVYLHQTHGLPPELVTELPA